MSSVSVLLATYEPRMDWLSDLLKSLCRQTLLPKEIIICDDGSSAKKYDEIARTANKIITGQIEFRLYQNKENLGSDKTFERLTKLGKEEFFAYCDQDDIWEPQQLQLLVGAMESEIDTTMAYSDMSVIDQNGEIKHKSMRQLRAGLEFADGRNQAYRYTVVNCSAACAMLVRADKAKQCIPFFEGVFCDQWLAVCMAAWGRIIFVNRPLVRYRRHDDNQTSMMSGINNKKNYMEKRVRPAYELVYALQKRNIHYVYENHVEEFVKARMRKDIVQIWHYRRICRKYAYFDIAICLLPEKIVSAMLKLFHGYTKADIQE